MLPDTEDPYRVARGLADATGTDARAVWEWAAIERVSTALVLLSIGRETEGRGLLRSAEAAATFG